MTGQVTTTEGALEPLFLMDWSGELPYPDHELSNIEGYRVDVYECQRCGALTTKPQKHWAWHGVVDTNTTAET